tara:strand:- start:4386 stop:4916 length:531 start_codon:yes stop_codon:yes gene_type:complete
MSKIDGIMANDWIEKNKPKDGLFRVYWKDTIGDVVVDNDHASATFDENEGQGLRYEWYYKNEERADGESKGWYSNGMLRSIYTYKDGLVDGLWAVWWPECVSVCSCNHCSSRTSSDMIHGTKRMEAYHKKGDLHGTKTIYRPNGIIESEEEYIYGKLVKGKYYDGGGKMIKKKYKE